MNTTAIQNVREYGAAGDGVTLDTRALQRAIDAAAVQGGRVVVPPGLYLCGTVFLKTRVVLDLMPGARILGSPRLEDYTPRTWGHNKDVTPWHLVMAVGAEHCGITGHGEIDGNGPAFWQKDRPHEWSFWTETLNRVSPMIQFEDCRHVFLEGITLRNSPGWTFHPLRCEHVRVTGVTLRNGLFGPNNDGIDINGCRYVTVSDCDIETGDDAIVLKTTEDARATEYVTVTNCILRTSCVALKLGTESCFPFRHITFSNCVIPSCSRAVSLISFDGGDIEDVLVSQVTGTTNSGWPVNRPIEIYAERRARQVDPKLPQDHPAAGRLPSERGLGRIRDVTLRDVDLVTDGRVMMVAHPDSCLENVAIDGLRLRYILLEDPSGLSGGGWIPGNHAAARSAAAAIVAENIRHLRIRALDITWPTYPVASGWHVLTNSNRFFNRTFYEGKESAIIQGQHRVPFFVVWGRGLRGGSIERSGIGSGDGLNVDIRDSTIETI